MAFRNLVQPSVFLNEICHDGLNQPDKDRSWVNNVIHVINMFVLKDVYHTIESV